MYRLSKVCPHLIGPSAIIVWTLREKMDGQEASHAVGDYWQAARSRDRAGGGDICCGDLADRGHAQTYYRWRKEYGGLKTD